MCFKYKEKKINKLGVVIISIVSLALAGLSVFGGIMALKNLPLVWGIVLIVLASIVALGLCALGVTLLFISFSMINTKNSVRDSNEAKVLLMRDYVMLAEKLFQNQQKFVSIVEQFKKLI